MNNVDIKDKSKEILEKIKEIKGCLDKLVNDEVSLFLEESYNTCQSCLEEITEEIAPYAQDDMPELKNGMFGIAKLKAGMFGISKPIPNGEINAFYVTEDTIIYEKGGWDPHYIFNKNGKSNYTQILALYNSDAKSFTGATAIYVNNPDSSKTIWKKED